ncbi:cytochrome c [Litorisediminicola beolgyonensis]|uniref:Cytochrome c n=1 Tax=Litorisediminicola beolgyonensis TaxID=1173614 RepID=A0ABW3ZGW6_9RHOB
MPLLSRLSLSLLLATALTPVSLAAEQHSDATKSQAMDTQGAAERGAYLAQLGGCSHCHQVEGGEAFAGGVRINTPFGVLIGPNITPDEETGIGSWSRDDFEGALRRGVNEEGEPLYPAMPYMHFTKLTDEDIDALWAYFQSVTPVRNEVDTVQLPFPYNLRRALSVWKAMYFEPARFEPNPDYNDQVNRGMYLAEGLVHCASCHTPRNSIGGPLENRPYQGASVDGWYAPNISGSAGSKLAKFDQEVLTAFLSDTHPDGLAAFGAMAQVTTSLYDAKPEDVEAIAAYILKRAEDDPEGEAPELEALSDEAFDRGLAVYESNCATCHGEDGRGNQDIAARLVNNGGVTAASPTNVVNVLLGGIAPRRGFGAMPAFADVLNDEEIADVTNYIRRAWDNDGARLANAALVDGRRNNVQEDPRVALAETCPTGDADIISDSLRERVTAMATEDLTSDQLPDAVDKLGPDLPEADYSRKVTALTSIYCNALAELGEGIDQAEVRSRQLAFINAVDSAIAGAN